MAQSYGYSEIWDVSIAADFDLHNSQHGGLLTMERGGGWQEGRIGARERWNKLGERQRERYYTGREVII